MRRIYGVIAFMVFATAPVAAQVRVEVMAPPPPSVEVRIDAPPPPQVRVAAPTVRYVAPPPLIEVEPGVQVVENSEQEVFFVGGWYWPPGPDGWWYRTRDHRGGWVAVPPGHVPGALVRLPRGRYRHFRREERREEHAERKFEKAERKAERRDEKAERKGNKHH